MQKLRLHLTMFHWVVTFVMIKPYKKSWTIGSMLVIMTIVLRDWISRRLHSYSRSSSFKVRVKLECRCFSISSTFRRVFVFKNRAVFAKKPILGSNSGSGFYKFYKFLNINNNLFCVVGIIDIIYNIYHRHQ